MDTYLCHITDANTGFDATLNRVLDGELLVLRGNGPCVSDAVSAALGQRTAFASSSDELDTCIAALRGRLLRLNVSGRVMRSGGLY